MNEEKEVSGSYLPSPRQVPTPLFRLRWQICASVALGLLVLLGFAVFDTSGQGFFCEPPTEGARVTDVARPIIKLFGCDPVWATILLGAFYYSAVCFPPILAVSILLRLATYRLRDRRENGEGRTPAPDMTPADRVIFRAAILAVLIAAGGIVVLTVSGVSIIIAGILGIALWTIAFGLACTGLWLIRPADSTFSNRR